MNPKVLRALASLDDGDHSIGGIVRKTGDKIALVFLTRDPLVRNLITTLLKREKGNLQRTFGVDPKTLNPKMLKPKTSTDTPTLH